MSERDTASRSSLDDVIDAYKPGVDVTLLDENLRRTPDERFRNAMQLQRFAAELRRAGRQATRRE